jgi:pilus assembly protein CpaE
MDPRILSRESELTALLIAPDRQLAEAFLQTVPQTKAFQILADLKTYPAQQTLEIRLRQLRPDVVLLDLATDLETAGGLIRFLAAQRPVTHVIGLHVRNDSDAIVRSLRMGASEFLSAPFDRAVQREATARIHRLRHPEPSSDQEFGKVIAFSSVKPGSGASTLATQTAFTLRKKNSARVLLADFDLEGGTIGFYLKIRHNQSLVDALGFSDRMDAALWSSLTVNNSGVDVLPAPDIPVSIQLDPPRIHEFLEYARLYYDWVVLDLPTIYHRISLLAVSESDRAFLISTSELPSLHMARKAVALINQLGFERQRQQVLINRVQKADGLGSSELEKLVNCSVSGTFPNDYLSLHRMVTLGRALEADCELGKAIEGLVQRLAGIAGADKRRTGALAETKPALSQT